MVRYDERHRVITTTAAGSAQATGRRQRQAAEGPQRAASAGLQHRPHQRTETLIREGNPLVKLRNEGRQRIGRIRFADDLRLSDIEPRFVCKACG